jgi:hypothetical protein
LTLMRPAVLFLSVLLSATTSDRKALGERQDLRAELGGISSLLILVDAPSTVPGSIQVVSKADLRERARQILTETNRRIIPQEEALKSMKGVGVVRIAIDVVTAGAAERVAVNLETEVRRRALIDCCAYYGLAVVWRTQELKVTDEKSLTAELDRMVERQMRSLVSALRSVPERPPPRCDSCQLFDGN